MCRSSSTCSIASPSAGARAPLAAHRAPSQRSTQRRMATEMRVTVIPSVAAVLLTGCMMGPDYVRPKVDVQAAFRFEPKVIAETADTEWWKQFGDPVLDALIAEALANNLNVKVAAANVEQAAGVFTQTRSQLFPQVGYSVSGERARTSEAATKPELARLIPNPQSAYQAVLTASWEIDLWGRIRRLSESARANALASDEA